MNEYKSIRPDRKLYIEFFLQKARNHCPESQYDNLLRGKSREDTENRTKLENVLCRLCNTVFEYIHTENVRKAFPNIMVLLLLRPDNNYYA